MKKSKLLVIVFVIGMITSCAQSTKSKKEQNSIQGMELPDNFLNSAGNISANTQGVIHLETEYLIKNNEIGNAEIFMIHKNGGSWWMNQAKKKFPNNYYAERFFADFLFTQDSVQLKDYNKWAFFIDKKYLEERLESAEGGEFTSHYPSKNSEIVIVLYEQKSGTSNWKAIDSFTFNTDGEGNEIATKDEKGNYYGSSSRWESNFIEDKVIESNN